MVQPSSDCTITETRLIPGTARFIPKSYNELVNRAG